ncbi:MAG: flavin-containing monooxygenase, partial [Acidimicrobiia bacterium]
MSEIDPLTSSPFVRAIEPITETDDEIASALADAEVPPLLPALAFLTGDLSLLRDDLRPDPLLGAMPQGGMTEEQLATARALALEVLIRFRDSGCVPTPPPSEADLLRIMEHTVGETGIAAYLPLLSEELAVRDRDHRAPDWRRDEIAPATDFSVVVIGAGMSGLLAAHRLQQADIPFVVLEKDDDVGGTWLENTYPGCRVDNPNHNYSYSFAQRHDWPFHFSTQGVLQGYFRDCADVFAVRDHVRFGTEVLSAVWSDDHHRWTVRTRDTRGHETTIVADAVISAVGQLNRPSYPDIEGRESFEGPAFHSARWDHSVDLTGKRVAVIGTGASAVQFIPEIAPAAGALTVFQRTPAWLIPTPDYHESVAPGLRWLYGHVPSYSEWNRFWIFWRMGDASIEAVRVDDAWDRSLGSVSGANELVRMIMTGYLELEFADRPDLLPRVLPDYPPGAKRMLRDNGVWARTLKRENVALVCDPIARITPKGVVTADGTEHVVDVIVYGTGFEASKFLTPMRVTGRDGVDLHGKWAGDARAYLGITVPGFPNLFCLYGPNTNIVINGSIIYFSECEAHYITESVRLLLESGSRSMDCRRDVHDEYNERVDEANRGMAWGASTVNTWYKNASGRVAQNWPFPLLEFWRRTRVPDPDDYVMK